MPVELRKRAAKAPPPAPAPPKKKAAKAKAAKAKAASKEPAAKPPKQATEAAAAKAPAAKPNGASKKPAVGDTVDLATFGTGPGGLALNDGTSTTLAALVEASTAGVVLFTYPKASTPGCTTQACLFRDSYAAIGTDAGLAVFGLSRDSPKANSTFKDKQKLPYPLLCDPKAGLISAIGFAKAPAGTQRGVFVVDKKGKVLVAEAGGPAATLEAVKTLIKEGGLAGRAAANGAAEEEQPDPEAEKNGEDPKETVNGDGDGPTAEDKQVDKAEADGI